MNGNAKPLNIQPELKFFLSEEAKKVGLVFTPPRNLDAGFDLPSLLNVIIPPKSSALIQTGLYLSIPENWVGLVRDRSSVALKGGLTVAGVIDASYRGEVKVLMYNLNEEPLVFKQGERIAQCIIVQHLAGAYSKEVENLEDLGGTERGVRGFGSTGN